MLYDQILSTRLHSKCTLHIRCLEAIQTKQMDPPIHFYPRLTRPIYSFQNCTNLDAYTLGLPCHTSHRLSVAQALSHRILPTHPSGNHQPSSQLNLQPAFREYTLNLFRARLWIQCLHNISLNFGTKSHGCQGVKCRN